MRRLTGDVSGRNVLYALAAWFTRALRSARNKMRLAQFARINTSDRAITVRVLPDPVAITSSAARWRLSSKPSVTLRIARV
ncbi:Uncharacterised protein [Mycobacteroides abscessus subsp. abscessus]|nr:Uncharacterised protein [Mycobacteroides abscessus subsp. abscessus]